MKYLDITGLTHFWEKIKETFIAKPSTGNTDDVLCRSSDGSGYWKTFGILFRYKGTVANYAALTAITVKEAGDVYRTIDDNAEYYYDGTGWELFGTVSSTPNVLRYKGTKTSVSDLPTSGQSVGDLWLITGTSTDDSYHTEYFYTGDTTVSSTGWELVGPVLTAITDTEIDTICAN